MTFIYIYIHFLKFFFKIFFLEREQTRRSSEQRSIRTGRCTQGGAIADREKCEHFSCDRKSCCKTIENTLLCLWFENQSEHSRGDKRGVEGGCTTVKGRRWRGGSGGLIGDGGDGDYCVHEEEDGLRFHAFLFVIFLFLERGGSIRVTPCKIIGMLAFSHYVNIIYTKVKET
jgi:hypothetical protein